MRAVRLTETKMAAAFPYCNTKQSRLAKELSGFYGRRPPVFIETNDARTAASRKENELRDRINKKTPSLPLRREVGHLLTVVPLTFVLRLILYCEGKGKAKNVTNKKKNAKIR